MERVRQMTRCAQAACASAALAPWWRLCAPHTLVLDERTEPLPTALGDQAEAAGWDAATWAERIAPHRWGQADEHDPWVMRLRALTLAHTVTGTAEPCAHATRPDIALPLVVAVRAPHVLACPTCAEPTVAGTTTDGHACDRCSSIAVTSADRTALLVGQSLVLVAQLCAGCATGALARFDLLADDG